MLWDAPLHLTCGIAQTAEFDGYGGRLLAFRNKGLNLLTVYCSAPVAAR